MQPDPTHIDPRPILFPHPLIRLAWAVLLVCGWASGAGAEDQSPAGPSWEITADQITYDSDTETYAAEGNVRVVREGRVLTADSVRMDQKSRLAWAEGNVRLLSGQDTMTGRSLQLDLDKETGSLWDGSLFLSENHMYVKGRLILKTGPQTYQATDAELTTCDGPAPDWHISSKELRVTLEGYGFAKHAAFWADDWPLMYTPYMIFPVKLKRQSGLLAPELGYSDRRGAEYLQPLFWAISDSMDATLYTHAMTERGVRLGAEYRYVAGERSRGTLMADWLSDRRTDDGLGDNSSRWGYTDDAFLRTNRERYWLRGKIDQDLAWGATAKVDVDVVSDQDYLEDFGSGVTGFNESKTAFLRTFGRDIDDFTEPYRKNQLNLNRLWSDYTFNGNVRWYEDAVRDRPPGALQPVQNLPEITLDGIKQKIGRTPFYYDLSSAYSHLYVEDGDRGHRADLYPRLYYPARFFDAFSFEPSAGIRQTAWYMDRYGNAPADGRSEYNRTLYDFRLDTSTELYRIYALDVAGCDRLKHNLMPQLIYQYIPGTDQNDYPHFDDLDRIDEQNRVTFALTQMWIARQPGLPENPLSRPTYIPFMRFRLEESFDIKRYQDDDPRPFSDLFGELDLIPGRYVSMQSDFRWRPYDGEFYGYNLGVLLWDLRGDRLGLDYRLTRQTEEWLPIHSLNAAAAWQVTTRWQLRGKYEHDLERRQMLETGVGIAFRAQCWGVDFDYRRDAEEKSSFSVMLHLAGLGSLGR